MTPVAAKTRRARPRSRRLASWLRDRPSAAIAGLSAIALVLFSVLVPVHAAAYGIPVPVAMLLGAAAVASPSLSMWYPRLAIVLFTSAAVLFALIVPRDDLSAPWPWSVPMLLAFAAMVVAVTFAAGWRFGLVQLALGATAGLTAAVVHPDQPSANSLIVTTAVVGGIYLVAVLLAGRLRIGEELTRERAHTAREEARRELVEERTRIARELHDVVAHSMSLVQVQAATARYRVPDLPPTAAAEFDDIAASARAALTEMRRILGVLRTDDHEAELAPQRGVDDIAALVESTRRAGASVALVQELSGDVSPATQIAAYRIMQEAISNAVRHAPGSAILVSVTGDGHSLELKIRNAPIPNTVPGAQGHGLRGMAERAALLGGHVDAGPAHGGWRVSAVLPRHPPSPSAEEGAQ